MKKLLLSLAVLAGSASMASAQSSNAIKANIFSPIVRTGSFFFEHKVSDNNSAQLGFFFTGFSVSDTKFSGFGLTPEYRFYLSGEAMDGFYVGPYLRYQNFTITDDMTAYGGSKSEASLSTIGGGVSLGRQWMFKNRFTLDPFLGLGYSAGSLKAKGSANEEEFSGVGNFKGFGLRTGLTVGIAF
jgi:hypothetical protein